MQKISLWAMGKPDSARAHWTCASRPEDLLDLTLFKVAGDVSIEIIFRLDLSNIVFGELSTGIRTLVEISQDLGNG